MNKSVQVITHPLDTLSSILKIDPIVPRFLIRFASPWRVILDEAILENGMFVVQILERKKVV